MTRSIPWLFAALWLATVAGAQEPPVGPGTPPPAPPAPSGEPAPPPAPAPPGGPATPPADPAAAPAPADAPSAASPAPTPVPAATAPVAAAPAAEPAAAPAPPAPSPEEPAAPPAAAPDAEAGPEGEQQKLATRDATSVAYVPGKGFTLRTDDGDFSTTASVLAQLRYSYRGVPGPDRQVLQVRRGRLSLSGNVFGEHNRYKLQLGFAAGDVSRGRLGVEGDTAPVDEDGDAVSLLGASDVPQQSPLLDLYLEFTHLRDLNLRVGQGKVPFSRQLLVSAGKLQFVDRSGVDGTFNLGRDMGMSVGSSDLGGLGMLRYSAGVFSGEGRNASDRTLGSGDDGFLYVVRAEVTPLGAFDAYAEVDHERLKQPRLAIALAYALVQGDATSPRAERDLDTRFGSLGDIAVVDYNSHNFTADAVFKVAGLSATAAFHLRKLEGNLFAAPSAPAPLEGIGFNLAAGYLFPGSPVEAAVSYGLVDGTGDDTALADEKELGVGLSYYMVRHALKLQGDFFHDWGPDGFGEGDDRLRLQLQGML